MHNPIMMSWSHGLIKFSQIGFSLVGVGRGGAEKPASRLKKRLLRYQTQGGKFYHVGSYITNQLSPRHKPSLHATLNDSLLIL